MIKSTEIMSSTIKDAIAEIEFYHMEEVKHIAEAKGWAISDAVEAIATHIIYTDTDYTGE